ncbi:MAG: hypothetical protein PSX80_14805 [bacterium]|nr:hypothetical protein [bacterium]
MLISLLIVAAITAGGLGLTYLIERDEPLLWRIAAGNVIGSAIFGTVGFCLAMAFGLNAETVMASLIIVFAAGFIVVRGERRNRFDHDLAKARGKIQGSNTAKILPFFYYAGFLILLVFFFDRAMIQTDQGIFTGGSNNLGDLPFHLGAIYSFSEGMNFPPENPNWAGATFSYPFIPDLITASFLKLGISVRDAMFIQNVSWAFSLLVLLEAFVRRSTGLKNVAKLAPVLLFFSGGLGFIWFLGSTDGLWNLTKDYTIGDEFRWGNSLTTLFLTQRSLLLGMPITLIVLGFLWRCFAPQDINKRADFLAAITLGILAGCLPLIHLHSLAVLFVVSVFVLAMNRNRWREVVAFGIGASAIAIPELLWSMSGSATRASEFLAWHFGFDSRDTNIFLFWIKNTGLFVPLIAFGIYLLYRPQTNESIVKKKEKDKTKREREDALNPASRFGLVYFYIPFVFLFLLANVAKLAPWEWDNIKVLIYWFVGSLPFVVIALAWMWQKETSWKVVAVLAVVILTASGGLDVWRTVSAQINYPVFSPDAIAVAGRIRAVTPPRSMFLNAPTYNSAVVLTGRRSLMRYPGHLSSHGIDYMGREEDVKKIYRGGPEAIGLMEKYGIEYVMISPEEREMSPNQEYFSRFPIVAQSGQYRVHRIK